MVVNFDVPHNARQAQDMNWLETEDVLERLSMPDGIDAKVVRIDARRAKVEAHVDGGINFRLSGNKGDSFIIDTNTALESVAKLSNVPISVLKNFPDKMTTPLLSHAIKGMEGLAVVADDNNRIIQVEAQTKMKPIMPVEQVVENLFMQWPELKFQDAQMGKGYQGEILAITNDGERKLEELLAPGLHEFLPEGGDPFRSGVRISHNPIGFGEPLIEPYLLRLVCRNGAIHAEYLHNQWGTGYGEGDEVWQWFREGLQASNVAIDGIMQNYADMVGQEVPANERSAVVEGYLRNARLPNDEARAIRDMAINEPPRTMYDLFNMATANATHNGNNTLDGMIHRQRNAAKQAGTPDAHARYCPTCRR